jgi:trigger factor
MELIQNKEGLVATLTVKISQEDYAAKVEKELRKRRQTTLVKGFRPGNAPVSLIKKMYESPILVEEINKLLSESIKNYEQENAGHLFGQVIPSADNQPANLTEQKDFEFIYDAGFLPEFTYSIDENTELPYYNIIFEDRAIDTEIEAFRDIYYTTEHVEEVDDDCLINVNINLVIEGEEKTHSTSILMSVISNEHKPLFLGAKVNDTVNVEIRKVFTNEIDLMGMLEVNKDELALLPETLPFTITAIVKKAPAELNQEFFDYVAGKDQLHSEEELREYLKTSIIKAYEVMSLDKLYRNSVEIIKEKANIAMPEDFIRKYVRFLQKEDSEISDEDIESAAKYFTNESKWKYIMASLLNQNEITVTYEMIKEEAKRMLRKNFAQYSKPYSEADIEGFANYYLKNEEYLQNIITKVKAQQFAILLKTNAKLNVTDVTVDEFHKICEQETAATDNALEDNNDNKEEQE